MTYYHAGSRAHEPDGRSKEKEVGRQAEAGTGSKEPEGQEAEESAGHLQEKEEATAACSPTAEARSQAIG